MVGGVETGSQNYTITQSLCSRFKSFITTKVEVGAVQPPQCRDIVTAAALKLWLCVTRASTKSHRTAPKIPSVPLTLHVAQISDAPSWPWGTTQCSSSRLELALSPWHGSIHIKLKSNPRQTKTNKQLQCTPTDLPSKRLPSVLTGQSSSPTFLKSSQPAFLPCLPFCASLASAPIPSLELVFPRESVTSSWLRQGDRTAPMFLNVWHRQAPFPWHTEVPSISGSYFSVSYTCYLPLCMSHLPHFPREIWLLWMPSILHVSTHHTPTDTSMKTTHGCFRVHTTQTALMMLTGPSSASSEDLGNGTTTHPVALALASQGWHASVSLPFEFTDLVPKSTCFSSWKACESASLSIPGHTASSGLGIHHVLWAPLQMFLTWPPVPWSVPLWLTICTASMIFEKQNVSMSLSCLKFRLPTAIRVKLQLSGVDFLLSGIHLIHRPYSPGLLICNFKSNEKHNLEVESGI